MTSGTRKVSDINQKVANERKVIIKQNTQKILDKIANGIKISNPSNVKQKIESIIDKIGSNQRINAMHVQEVLRDIWNFNDDKIQNTLDYATLAALYNKAKVNLGKNLAMYPYQADTFSINEVINGMVLAGIQISLISMIVEDLKGGKQVKLGSNWTTVDWANQNRVSVHKITSGPVSNIDNKYTVEVTPALIKRELSWLSEQRRLWKDKRDEALKSSKLNVKNVKKSYNPYISGKVKFTTGPTLKTMETRRILSEYH